MGTTKKESKNIEYENFVESIAIETCPVCNKESIINTIQFKNGRVGKLCAWDGLVIVDKHGNVESQLKK